MRNLLNRNGKRRLFVALAAGSLILPAAISAQYSSVHKTSRSSSATAAGTTGSASTKKTSKSRRTASRKSKRVKGQAAPTSDRINEIQSALVKQGFYDGEPSGKWDDSSAEALRKFQTTNGLTPTGKLDARTLQKLGLGSGTAGLGSPTPPPNSANRLLSSKAQRDEVKNETEQPE